MFRFHYLQKLPPHVRDQVSACDHMELREVAKLADKVFAQRRSTTVLVVQDEEEVDAVRQTTRGRSGPRGLPQAGSAPMTSKGPRVCRFHVKCGEKTRNCLMPCSWNGKVAPAPGNEPVGSQPRGDLFFVQCAFSGRRYLVNTGAQVSIVPPTSDERRTPGNRHLIAANHSKINTYGAKDLTLNLAGRFTHAWRFIIADVNNPILGSDFLRNAGLLVDLRGQRLLDSFSLVSIPLQAARSGDAIGILSKPSNEFEALLLEFPSVLTPSFDSEVKHGVRHHILTKSSPTCPRRSSGGQGGVPIV